MDDNLYSIILTSAPFLRDAVVHFVESYPERLAEFDKELQEKDFEAIQKAAHRLKGAAGTHGYPAVSESAKRLDTAAREKNEEDVRRFVGELRAFENRLVPEAPGGG